MSPHWTTVVIEVVIHNRKEIKLEINQMSSHEGIKCEPAFQMITQLHIAGVERG